MQEIEPLSPSEAARIVSEQRWSHGEAQERETSGTPEPELKDGYGVKGVEQGLGYRDMAMAYPVKTPASGISEPELNQRWQTDPTLRSYQAQTLLFEAARGRVARRANAEMQKSIREKAVRPVPIVQRPGSPTEIESRENFDMRKMSERL